MSLPQNISKIPELFKIWMHFRSGGPLMDIIETSEGSRTGYLAVRATDYADCIANILYNTKEENETTRNAARFVISIIRFNPRYEC